MAHSGRVRARDGRGFRAWVFVWNNFTESADWVLDRFASRPNDVRYVVFQHERGEEGVNHFQGYVSLRKQMRSMESFLPNAWWSKAEGSPQSNVRYCTKEDTRVEGPWTFGDVPSPGKRTDLEEACEMVRSGGLRQVADEMPVVFAKFGKGLRDLDSIINRPDVTDAFRERRNVLCYGATRTGKSRWAREQARGTDYYVHTNTAWFDGYLGESVVIMDDYGTGNKLTLDILLKLLDHYDDFRVPVKGAFVRWHPDLVILTSNRHPYYWYDWNDRPTERNALAARFTAVRVSKGDGSVRELTDPGEIMAFFGSPGVWPVD